MAGAGCLLGCENNVANAAAEVNQQSDAPVLAATGEACASAHSSNCCASHGARVKRPAVTQHHEESKTSAAREHNPKASFGNTPALMVEVLPLSMMNCPLAVDAAAVLSKYNSQNPDSAVAVGEVQKPVTDNLEQIKAFARPLRLPNRGHTYLRCCVFLI